MARPGKSVADKIQAIDEKIQKLSEKLVALKQERKVLENQRQEVEAQDLFTLMKEMGVSAAQLRDMLSQQHNNQNNEYQGY